MSETLETLNIELVRHVAELARIELSDAQCEEMTHQLRDVLQHVNKLQQLDTEGVEPMPHAVGRTNVLADDIAGKSLTPDEALRGAPEREENFFRVPKVLPQGSGGNS